jgi:hypothetical protein
MDLFNRTLYINRILLSCVLASFSLTTLYPPAHCLNIDLNDANFMYGLEKSVEKLLKLKKKDSITSIIGCGLDIKNEIERYYNTSLDLSQFLDHVEKEINKQGGKFKKNQFKYIKDLFKKSDKKKKSLEISDENYFIDYGDELFLMKSKHGSDKEDKEEIVLPAQLVYGVTVALVGFFLMVIPIPACKPWGEKLMLMGASAAANSLCNKADENREKERDKK